MAVGAHHRRHAPSGRAAADLWALAAVLSAPPVSAWALAHFGGTALSGDAIKLSARQILEHPRSRPVTQAWAEGAGAARAAHDAGRQRGPVGVDGGLHRLGRTMTEAYGASDDVSPGGRRGCPPWR